MRMASLFSVFFPVISKGKGISISRPDRAKVEDHCSQLRVSNRCLPLQGDLILNSRGIFTPQFFFPKSPRFMSVP